MKKKESCLKDAIAIAMKVLSRKPNVVFLGENIINSKRIYGTLNEVPLNKCIEMPVCENLIAGVAIGLALEGWRPVCIFQRMDFMFIAADAIINHACVFPKLNSSVKLPIIFRTIKADLNQQFYVGHQHSKDLTHVFSPYLPVFQIPEEHPKEVYEKVWKMNEPVLVVEDYAQFNKRIN